MCKYGMVAENMESTIVAKYDSEKTKETKYQSEADLEKAFIKQLQAQAYEYLPLKTEQDLINNLRKQLEKNKEKMPSPEDLLIKEFERDGIKNVIIQLDEMAISLDAVNSRKKTRNARRSEMNIVLHSSSAASYALRPVLRSATPSLPSERSTKEFIGCSDMGISS